MNGDEVRLRLPGDPVYGRLARIAATSLARRLGFTFRQMEDLGLAVDETVILLLHPGPDGRRPASVDVRLVVERGGLEVTAEAVEGDGGTPWPTDEDRERFAELVDPVVAAWELDPDRHRVRFAARR